MKEGGRREGHLVGMDTIYHCYDVRYNVKRCTGQSLATGQDRTGQEWSLHCTCMASFNEAKCSAHFAL